MSTEHSPNATPPASTEGGIANVARRARRSWTSWEDQSLRSRVAQYGHARGSEGRWTEIAQGIPGRTAKDCRKRWFHSLDPSLRKGRWTEGEDRILLEAYARLGPAWKQIADLIPGRKDDQCSKRYVDILGPLAKNRLSGWTPEEDRILRDSVADLGHRWSAVAARLPGRPPLTCRNRWRNLSKQSMASKSAAEQQTSPENMQSASENDAAEHSMSPTVSRPSDEPGTVSTLPESIAVSVDIPDIITVPSQLDYPHSMSIDSNWNAGLTVDAAHSVPYDAVQDLDNVPEPNLPLAAQLINWDMESSWEDQNASTPNVPPIPMINPLPAQASTSALQNSVEDHNQPPHHDPSYRNSVDFRALELSAEMSSRSDQQLSNIPEEPHHDAQGFPPATTALTANIVDEQLLTDQPSNQEFRHVTHYHHYHHHYHHHHHHYHHYSQH